MKKALFICSANKDRSRTAEDMFADKFPMHQFDSAGTNQKICNQLGTSFINEHQLDWADVVYVMEQKHLQVLRSLFGNEYSNKIEVLNIKDIYQYGAEELKEIFENKLFNVF